MTTLVLIAAALALLPAINTFVNARLLQTPAMPRRMTRVAILIPARDEEATIGTCVDAALASIGADIEVIVLDDGSSDRTRQIVEQRAQLDPRLRLASAPPLPEGWKGKPHACQVLSGLTDRPYLLFVDSDVRLTPTAAARLVPPEGIDLVSAVPRQQVRGLVETSIIPMINNLIFGYLPVGLMRRLPQESLTAACGQMMMVRASVYREVGGHGAIAGFMHDGMQLAKSFRRNGFRTDLVHGAALAECRMYHGAKAVFDGFAKNATEGMARPVALPVWTVLLAGGHLLPLVTLPFVYISGAGATLAGGAAISSAGLLLAARVLQAVKCGEPWQAVVLHPLGVLLTLAIQWRALVDGLRGRRVEWRGRSYAPTI
ncbi:glycosyltransferase family 2 protein [Bradyrhizobium sp.]|uniref:glycosyltransferase n=1 Tax=Bradyrhizobium sp. TaxID=376 RepID=UPI0025BECFFA|nr:glycosyltransferase family 2 protein [Bradyrhizobium sp.]